MKNIIQQKIGFILIAVLAFTFASGFTISTLKVDKKAFGKKKRFAIVSISGGNKIRSDNQSGGLIGGLKALSKKHSFSVDGMKILNGGGKIIESELRKSKHFTLVPSSRIIRSKAYKSLKGDKARKIFGAQIVPAKGFKYFKSKKTIKSLAKKLNVDGAIIIYSMYSVGFSGVTIGSGLISTGIGKQYGMVTISIIAMDKNGKRIWKQTQQYKSKKGMGSTGGAADFKKMYPYFLQAAKNTTRKLLKKLDKKLK